MDQVKQEAVGLSKTMNLSVVRLCFQAFLPDEHGRFTIPVEPVFSHKVYDSSEWHLLMSSVGEYFLVNGLKFSALYGRRAPRNSTVENIVCTPVV